MAKTVAGGFHDLSGAIGRLGVHDHLCLIYETREEQFAAVIPYIRLGLERGEKCLYVADDNTAQAVDAAMEASGINVEGLSARGALSVVGKRDVYLKKGSFDPDWLIEYLRQAAMESKAEGFSALRITGEMTWVLGGDPGSERLMEYESKLNNLFPTCDALAICQYNRRRFSPEVIKDVIATHPLVIYGGRVCRNFYYVPPDDLLARDRPEKEVDRLLANIFSREAAEEELRRYQERLEELARERTAEAEEAQYEQQQVFRILVENSPDIIARYDRDCRRTYVNPTYLEVAKDTSQALLEKAPLQSSPLPPESAALLQDLLRRVLDSGVAEALDLVWRRDGEDDYWYNIYAYPEFDREGRVASVMTVSRDITGRKRADRELRKSEERYRQLLDTIQEGVWVIDRDSKTTFANPRLAEMLGYSVAEMMGRPLFDFMDDRGRKIAEGNVERRRRGIKEQHDFEFVRKDGARIYTRLETGPILDEAGEYAGAIAAVADISERRKAEDALKLLNEELESRVRERTAELERRNYELEQMNRAFVGRELKMVELKDRIKALEESGK